MKIYKHRLKIYKLINKRYRLIVLRVGDKESISFGRTNKVFNGDYYPSKWNFGYMDFEIINDVYIKNCEYFRCSLKYLKNSPLFSHHHFLDKNQESDVLGIISENQKSISLIIGGDFFTIYRARSPLINYNIPGVTDDPYNSVKRILGHFNFNVHMGLRIKL